MVDVDLKLGIWVFDILPALRDGAFAPRKAR